MKSLKTTCVIIFTLPVLLLSACSKEAPKSQIAIIDMHKISEAVNLGERVKEFSDALSMEINGEISELSTKFKQEIEDEKASFGEIMSSEQQGELNALKADLQKQFNEARMAANVRINQERHAYKQSILDDITPVAQQVATEHGAVIIFKNKPVVWSEKSLDITSEVISRLPALKQTEPVESTEPNEPTDQIESNQPEA